MNEPPGDSSLAAKLVVRRRINAPREKLFAAWTQPALLVQWWGPPGVACTAAEIDLRIGGAYRIANRFTDGSVLWIAGRFEVIEPPERLTYTWKLETPNAATERVTVCFEAHGAATEVIVTHEQIADDATRSGHQSGWAGCLDGLSRYAEQAGGALR